MNDEGAPVRYRRELVFAPGEPAIAASQYLLSGSFEPHSHDFVEIALVGAGAGEHASAGGRQPLRRGDLFVFRTGAWHAYRDCRDLLVDNCCFGAELLDHDLAALRDDSGLAALLGREPHGVRALHIADAAVERCRPHLDALRGCGERGAGRVERLGHLLLLFSQLGEALAPAAPKSERIHPAVRAALALLGEDLARPWSLVELAYRLHIDPSHLTRLFNAHLGLSPMAYLAEQRLARARLLLAHTDLSVSAVGAAVGFDNPSHFARRFRSRFGEAPSACRGAQTE